MLTLDQMTDGVLLEELVSFLIDYQGWSQSDALEFVRDMDREAMLNFLQGQ